MLDWDWWSLGWPEVLPFFWSQHSLLFSFLLVLLSFHSFLFSLLFFSKACWTFSMWVDLVEKGWGWNVSQRTFECSVKKLRILFLFFLFLFLIILYKYYNSSYSLSLACCTDIHFTPGKSTCTFSSDTTSRNRAQIKQTLTHGSLLTACDFIFPYFSCFWSFSLPKLLGWKLFISKSR